MTTRERSEPTDARRAVLLHRHAAVTRHVEDTLNHGIFVVRAARNLAEAQATMARWTPHIAIVDLEHEDAIEFMRRIGASNTMTPAGVPVLVLDRNDDVATRLRAFDLGADDALSIPFVPAELLARCIAITRRASGAGWSIIPPIALGGIEIDVVRGEIRAGGEITFLTAVEQRLLALLAEHAGATLTRDQIVDGVWGADFMPESNIVDRHIRSVRVKLRDDYRRPRFIATVSGAGYRFIPTFSSGGWGMNERRAPAGSPP